jgi:hypothetical protein
VYDVFIFFFTGEECCVWRIYILFYRGGVLCMTYLYSVLQGRNVVYDVFIFCFTGEGCRVWRIYILFYRRGALCMTFLYYVIQGRSVVCDVSILFYRLQRSAEGEERCVWPVIRYGRRFTTSQTPWTNADIFCNLYKISFSYIQCTKILDLHF